MYSSISGASYVPQARARPGIKVLYRWAQRDRQQGERRTCSALPRKAELLRARHEQRSQRIRRLIERRGEKVSDHEKEAGHAH